MSAAHTPGPWTHGIGFVRNMGRDVLGVGVQAIDGGDWTPVAALSFVEDVNDTDRANACLIAAAPDLLQALQPFVLANSSEDTIVLVVRTADVTRARAAILKATGAAS